MTILCDRSGPASVGLPAVPAGTVLRTYNVHRKWGTKGKENILINKYKKLARKCGERNDIY